MKTLTEAQVLSEVGRLSAERLTVIVARSWVRPRLSDHGQSFDETDLARLRLIVEMTEDLDINDEAVPVILHLIDEVSTLRHHIRLVDAALAVEQPAVRDSLAKRVKALFPGGAP